jgi:hypothetical protein
MLNTKPETLNSKQTQIPKTQNPKPEHFEFWVWDFGFI